MTISIVTLSNQQIEMLLSQIVAIYRDAFVVPPYSKPEAEITDFAQSLLGQLNRDGYRFAGALASDPGRILGFAYGYATRAALWWTAAVKPALTQDSAAVWLADSFQFVELVVDPSVQGQGIGGRLHDHLLRGLPYDRAVLSTLQADTVAHRLYRKRGWSVLCEDLFFPGVARRYQIMGLELKQ